MAVEAASIKRQSASSALFCFLKPNCRSESFLFDSSQKLILEVAMRSTTLPIIDNTKRNICFGSPFFVHLQPAFFPWVFTARFFVIYSPFFRKLHSQPVFWAFTARFAKKSLFGGIYSPFFRSSQPVLSTLHFLLDATGGRWTSRKALRHSSMGGPRHGHVCFRF